MKLKFGTLIFADFFWVEESSSLKVSPHRRDAEVICGGEGRQNLVVEIMVNDLSRKEAQKAQKIGPREARYVLTNGSRKVGA